MISYEKFLALKLFPPRGICTFLLCFQDSFFGFSLLMTHCDLGLLGFILFGMQAPVFLLHLGKFQPLFLGISFQAPPLLLEFWWQAHRTQQSGSGSAPFCSLALPFTQDAGSTPTAALLMPSSSSRTATGSVCWGSEFQSLYFSVLNLPSGASLYFYFSVKTASFHLKHAHDWELKHFYHDIHVDNSSISATPVLVLVNCLFCFSGDFSMSEFWMTLGTFSYSAGTQRPWISRGKVFRVSFRAMVGRSGLLPQPLFLPGERAGSLWLNGWDPGSHQALLIPRCLRGRGCLIIVPHGFHWHHGWCRVEAVNLHQASQQERAGCLSPLWGGGMEGQVSTWFPGRVHCHCCWEGSKAPSPELVSDITTAGGVCALLSRWQSLGSPLVAMGHGAQSSCGWTRAVGVHSLLLTKCWGSDPQGTHCWLGCSLGPRKSACLLSTFQSLLGFVYM